MSDDIGGWRFSEDTPGLFSELDLLEVKTVIQGSIRAILSYDSPRLIVLESWFLVDWLLRQILLTGINATQYRSEEFVPHYQLLPRSFHECLEALKNLISDQRRLPVEPSETHYSLTGSYELVAFITDEYPEVFKGIQVAQNAFLRKKLGVQTEEGIAVLHGYSIDSLSEKKSYRKHYRRVSEDWLKSVSRMDEAWFEKAEKLNTARNIAVHSVSPERIYSIFGIAGPQSLDSLRQTCIGILGILAGMKREKE